MTENYAKTLYEWLSQFATTFREPIQFDEDNPQPNEYITYSANTGNFAESFIQPISIYSKSTGWTNVMAIVDAIEENIGESGTRIVSNLGVMVIYKGSPFYQDKPDEDSSIRAGYVNLLIKVYQRGSK